MTTKKELIKNLKFCQDLMDRLLFYAENTEEWSCGSYHHIIDYTILANDIIRLRRELNTIRKSLYPYK